MTKKHTDNREDFLSINEDELDLEWSDQPKLYYRWARKLAKANLRLDEAEAELELTKADLDSEVRANPKKYKLKMGRDDKPTEPAIKAAILTAEEYTDAVSKVNKARFNVNSLKAMVQSIEHRKRALENKVDLLALDYRSEPRVSNAKGREAKKKFEKRVRRSYRRESADD